CPEHDAGSAVCAKPLNGPLNKQFRYAFSSARLFDDDVVDETRSLTQFLPGLRFESGINVSDDRPQLFGDENDNILLPELRTQKPCVALCHVATRSHETLLIEAMVCPQQQGA